MTTALTPLHGGGGFMLLGPFLLLAVGLGVLITWLVMRRKAATPAAPTMPVAAAPTPEDAGLRLLAERLGRGEITPEEYVERVNALRGHIPPTDPAAS